MTEEQMDMNTSGEGTPRWVGLALVVLAAISILGAGHGWKASTRAKSAEGAERALAEQNKDLQQNVAC